MRLRYRPMRTGDVGTCAELLAAQTVEARRYGSLIDQLPQVWLGLLRSGSLQTTVVEDVERRAPRIVTFGVSVFVDDEFLDQCKRAPLTWIAPELTRRVAQGSSPILAPKDIIKANSSHGLNLLRWVGQMFAHLPAEDQVDVELMRRFVEQHRGYNLKELVFQPPTAAFLRMTLNAGGLLWRPDQMRYVEAGDLDLAEVARRPFIMGITREWALQRMGTWAGSLFHYRRPHLAFSPAEQRLLLAAVQGYTDPELSKELGISLSFVKKMWRSVYKRVEETLPDLLPQGGAQRDYMRRGKEKKQRLLVHLREHPEELRPTRELLADSRPLRVSACDRSAAGG